MDSSIFRILKRARAKKKFSGIGSIRLHSLRWTLDNSSIWINIVYFLIKYGFHRNGVFVDIGGLPLALSYHQVPNYQRFVVLFKHLKGRPCVSFTFQVDEAKCKASSRPQRPAVHRECSSGDRVLVSFSIILLLLVRFAFVWSHIPLLASFWILQLSPGCHLPLRRSLWDGWQVGFIKYTSSGTSTLSVLDISVTF